MKEYLLRKAERTSEGALFPRVWHVMYL